MNENTYLLLALCGVGVTLIWNVVASARIVQELDKPNGLKPLFVMRYLPWRYLNEYRKLTVSQTGKVGPLYFHYTLSILAILLAALLLVVLLVV